MCTRAWVFATALCALAQPESIPRTDVKVVGPIEYGQSSALVRYTGKPKFSAFRFNARPGDQLDVTVNAKRGRYEAYLTDDSYRKLAGGEQHFTARIALDSKASTYYILVAEKGGVAGTFTLDLERPAKAAEPAAPHDADASPSSPHAADYLYCENNSQCVAVDRAGCCHNGWKDAVNKDRIAEYQQANACKDRHTLCAMYMVHDDRVAVCDTGKHQCAMVKPSTKP